MPDLNARDVEHAMLIIAGTARSMGVETELMRHGKNYRNLRAQIDREKLYSPVEAVRLLKGGETAKFDETVEAHFNLGLNVRHAEQQLRGTLMLPHGTGREAARRRLRRGREGARGGGGRRGRRRHERPRLEDRGRLRRLRRRGRDAGPDGRRRQARPHPRPAREDAEPEDRHGHDGRRQGRPRGEGGQARVPHRPRRERPRHIGKKSFDERQLLENYAALIDEIMRAKPSAAKGRYIKTVTLTSTMGPGIHVDPARTRGILEELEEGAPAEAAVTA